MVLGPSKPNQMPQPNYPCNETPAKSRPHLLSLSQMEGKSDTCANILRKMHFNEILDLDNG